MPEKLVCCDHYDTWRDESKHPHLPPDIAAKVALAEAVLRLKNYSGLSLWYSRASKAWLLGYADTVVLVGGNADLLAALEGAGLGKGD